METNCERCWRVMRWDGASPKVCTQCRLCGCGLDPEQIAATVERFEQHLEEETEWERSWQPVIVVVTP